MDIIKIDKGPVRRRKNHYKGRHDDSSTMTIILQVVRKTGKKMGSKDNTFIWLIRPHDADDTTTGPVWIPSSRTISTWTADMD
ncbi:hypothetical protein LEMLEM_LOCUS2253, partial [Lemmus lemmus]